MSNKFFLKHSSSWLVIGSITLLQAINGSRYSIFSTCSSSISQNNQQSCNFSHLQINYLIVASEIGKLFGFLPGAVVDFMPASMILSVGLIFGFVGYGVQYLSIANQISSLSYVEVLLLNFLAANSTCWINTYCYVLAIRNFKDWHLTLIGVTSSYSGFGGKFFSILVEGIEGKKASPNSNTYLLLTFLAPIAVGLIATSTNFSTKNKENSGKDLSAISFLLAILIGFYVLIESSILYFTHISLQLRAAILMLVLMLPFLIALILGIKEFATKKRSSSLVHPEMCRELDRSTRKVVLKEHQIEISDDFNGSKEMLIERNEVKLKEIPKNMEFWLFYLVNACGATIGIVYMINLERISKSLSGNGGSFLLEISSTFGFFGRIFYLIFEWRSRKKPTISNPAMTVFLMLPMPIAFFLLINNSNCSLYISTGILGTCSGALNTINATTSYELFGMKDFVTKQTLILTNIPLGILLFGCLSALDYQNEGNGSHGMCTGLQCFGRSFIIWGSVCFLATVSSFVLHLRTQNLYLQKS